MIIRGIFTNTKLSPTRMNSETTVPYIVANECPGLKRGDLVQLVGYDSKFQVVWTYASSREQESYETVTISEINGKQINTIGKNISSMEQFGKMDMSDVFGDLTKDMYDDFMPQAEEGAKISITDGVLCFKNSDGAYVGMSPTGKLKKYKMTYPMPCIYNISKNSDQIVIGDIVKSGRSYGVVKAKAEDGSIKIMNFNGNINNKIAIEDELMGSATFRVIVNPFNFDSSNGFNPLALAYMSGNKFDVKNLLMMSAMNGGGLFNNAGKGFNPMMLMALADNNSSDFMMSQLMGGGNGGEDPHMCWYFAANHIKTDALEKRGIKGCLITISDEPIHKTLPKEAVTHYIGDECGEDLATSFVYRECAEKWDIYHIHVEHDGYYGVERVSNSWKPYVGDNLIISDKEHVGESIARIVSNSYGQQTNS